MLTRKQYNLLMFINNHLNQTGVSPSFDEMKEALGLKSKSGIHRLIVGLEERGFIRRLPHRARALEIIKMPENIKGDGTAAGAGDRGFDPKVIEGTFSPGGGADSIPEGVDSIALPLYGRIAAGLPIEALRDHSRTIDVPASIATGGDHYALEVAGDSMIDAGILDGDTVIIRRADTADNGDIVVAVVDDYEVTLKRLRRRGDSIALEPANSTHETRIFGPDQVKVQGRLVGLIRHY